ncbi:MULTISPECIES: protein kinase domain-containing protein [Pelosinus]|uniref:ORC-CDC6 family AAA ATPase n=1 Tax=Pelosinus TaxID=365348 RepID=UPI001ED8D175|nr:MULTISPECIES: protein kinase [Pelosinus]
MFLNGDDYMEDIFIGKQIGLYIIKEHIGDGCIGCVYRGYREDIDESRALKFIKKENLRSGWENEISKVTKLRTTQGVVRYHTHNFETIEGEDYLYISWDYIPGESLKEIINKQQINMPIVQDVLEKVLEVLHACKYVGIDHADLHSGNIIIERSNPLSLNPEQRKVWITDFGYATAAGDVDILDDFKGLNRIIQQCLRAINFHELDGREKCLYSTLKNQFPKLLIESNSVTGDYVRNPKNLLLKWKESCEESKITQEYKKNIGDYLAAEHIGERYDEWKTLFVPKFLTVDDLLSKNICVLTGLRGCGKTMIFRRLTGLFNEHLGPSGVPGADSFIGFYLNARNIAEAFPWLPDDHERDARNQVINFFHLSWCLEIIDWLREVVKGANIINLEWLPGFFGRYYPEHFNTTENTINILGHITSLLNAELEKSRLQSKYKSEKMWELTDITFLEKFCREIAKYCRIDKPFYFFLDDYSTPLVTSATQRILNPLVFRRSSIVFFKVATESVESFEPTGLNGKILEEEDDYFLIDFATQVMLKSDGEIKDILSSILKRRIERHSTLANRNLELENLLGPTVLNNVQRSQLIRGEKIEVNKKVVSKEIYQGSTVFYNIWSSDIREVISLFAEMISMEEDEKLKSRDDKIISDDIQDTIFRDAGGKFLSLLEAATNPSSRNYVSNEEERSFGNHMVEIARAFQEIASFDLKNKTSKNVNTNPPKQARRIEITGVTNELTGKVKDYYRGLIRYGLFIRDNRGKSVRGKVVPRHYLRGLLIPYFRLSFSKRDSITLKWEEFCELLENPSIFKEEYKKQNRKTEDISIGLWDGENE